MKENEKVIDMVEDGEIVEETKISKVKGYVKDNWKKIAVGAVAIVAGAIGYSLGNRNSEVIYDLPPINDTDDVEDNSSTPEE